MSNTFYDEDGRTLPIPPHSPVPQQQEKLVLGSFHEEPQRSPRRPYQYRPQSEAHQPPPAAQPARNGQAQQGRPPAAPRGVPNSYPNQQPDSYQQPKRNASLSTPPRRRRKRGTGCMIGCLTVLLLICIISAFTFTTAQKVLAFGKAVSNQPPLSSQTDYMNTSDRTNLLVMGYGGSGHDGAYLTDSMMVISMLPQNQHTTLLSVPRDLWVQNPPNSGQYTKINAVYEFASNNNADPVAGGNAAAQKVSLVTGLDVKYWITINFAGFRDLINSIGGIDVYVPDAFNACYPKNDDANIDASWIILNFKKGLQHMDGNTAIAYARAREPVEVCSSQTSINEAELSDFARSARQQIIIKAVLAKIKQISTWPKLFDALNALQHTIYTNMSLADLAAFALKMNLNDPHTAHIGLSNQNVLMDSQSSDGQYILVPQNGDWQAIINYVKQHLYN
jgi:LCP family protein required for cell wall assembly